MSGWLTDLAPTGEVHVVPVGDLVTHEDRDCVCVPRCEPVPRDDGTVGWVQVHHSLDGREATEAD